MVNKSILKMITEYFRSREDIIAVYLFGSTVKNKERKQSDLDLAALFHDCIDQYQRFQAKLQIANDLEEHVKKKIDIVDLRSADLFFNHQIMKNKILLYDSDTSARVAFEVENRKRFFDHMPIYEQYHRLSRIRLREREG